MSKLTIDDVIGHCNRHTERIEKRMSREVLENMPIEENTFMKEYWEHRQVAEWLKELQAFKDKKEQGLLLELPVPIGGIVWGWEYPTRTDEDGTEWIVCDRRMAKVVPKEFCLMMLDRMGDMYFKTESEAEEALARMNGE